MAMSDAGRTMESNGRQPADQSVRAKALDPALSCIVQAPAGSGKTDLLIKRYLRLLTVVEEPEEILAITFTKKAAAEMRNRVLSALNIDDQVLPTEPNEQQLHELATAVRRHDCERDWNLLEHPNRLRIQTIDSFNAELTRQLPLLARFGVQPQISETPLELYEEAAGLTLEELEQGQSWSDAIAALLQHLDNDWHKVKALLTAMLPRRDQWLPRMVAQPGRADMEQALANEITYQLDCLRSAVPANVQSELVELATYAGAQLRSVGSESGIATCAGMSALPDATPGELPIWKGLAELLLTGQGEWRKKPNKNQGFPADGKAEKTRIEQLLLDLADCDEFRRRLHFVRQLPDPVYDDRQWQLLEALVELLPLAAAQLRVVFGARGQVDFPELALGAQRALGSSDQPTNLALRLDYIIRHILVDEFQDTSLSQFRLLESLIAGWQPGDGRSLFLVGDPMQSIYRFREAEVSLYLHAQMHGIGDLKLTPLQLGVNFRSRRGIVEWVNACFAEILPMVMDAAAGAVPFAPAEAWDDRPAEQAVTVHPQFGNDRAAEAQQVTAVIESEFRRDQDQRLAILVQSRKHLADIVPCLRARGMKYRAVEIEHLGSQPTVQDLLSLTRALLYPADRIAWLATLRAPWCGLTLADLHALAAGNPGSTVPELLRESDCLAALSMDGRARAARTWSIMSDALADRRRRSLRDSIEAVWLALGGPACAGSAAALDDAAVYFDLLDELDQSGDLPSAGMLMDALAELFAPSDPEADEFLQIMTVHKAKGLEFDTVILPGLGRSGRGDEDRLLLWLERERRGQTDLLLAPLGPTGAERDPVYVFLKALDQERQDYERGRLLYVAVTRAISRLHLFGHVNIKEPETEDKSLRPPITRSPLALLWPHVEAIFQTALELQQPPPATMPAEPVALPLGRLPAGWRLPVLPDSVCVPAPAATESEPAAPIEFSWAGESARIVGVVVHRLLLHMAKTGIDDWNPERLAGLSPLIRNMLLANGLPAVRQPEAMERVIAALTTTLNDDRGRWILDAGHHDAQSEYALSRLRDGRLESVILDRTFIDADGTRWIIDYKTGTHGGSDVVAFLDQEQQRYRTQLDRYAEFMLAMDSTRPVRLGLYFPMLAGWREWSA
jgi:ATP-dependent helicase/nuclease subunit A